MPQCQCKNRMSLIFKARHYLVYECHECARILIVSEVTGYKRWFVPEGAFPEFREYARLKYPAELDKDLITMIEDLIERRRTKVANDTGS